MKTLGTIIIALAALAGVAYFVAPSISQFPSFSARASSGPSTHLLLAVDVDALRRQQLENVADEMAMALRAGNPAIRYTGRGVVADAARIRLVSASDADRATSAIRTIAQSEDGAQAFAITSGPDGLIEARISEERLRALTHFAATQSIEVLRRRLVGFGRGVTVEQTEDDRILIRAQGVADMGGLHRAVGVTGLLSLHLVREISAEAAAVGNIPPGTMIAQPHPSDPNASPEVVERRPRFTGERLVRASPSTDPVTNEFVLSFQLDSEGTRIFCRITRDHVGNRFAILLDNQVLTAPRINEPICGGSGQISGNFTAQSANELAVLLRAGALPAPLVLIEEGVDYSP
ncbi:MAG: hypothetical protein H7124_13130 [Phycisphaerales bacterium]|nr:hypothetical protein [Hyphomonadaceae bacterium]